MTPSSTKKIKQRRSTSCTVCRTIKRKCDGNTPCSNCLKRNQECIYPDVDKRKKRYSIEYITNLENTNQQLHDQLQSLIDLKDNPYQLHLKITEILESSSSFLDNSETKSDSSLGSPELSKSEASLANSFTLGGELVVSSREQGANFHVHLNQQQQQQEQVQQEQVQQEQVQQDQMELEEDELPQQMPTPPEQPDEPEIPQLPEILDPTFFNSIVDNNGSTFNNIFSFDTEGFRL